MKTFTDIKTWLNSKPSEEEIKKVLDLINKGAKKELRVDLYKKMNEMKKLIRFADQVKGLGLEMPTDLTTKVKSLEGEIKEIESQLPTPVKKVKKEKVIEVKTEE
jgi:Zn-dependent metalloprotease